jgi:hypothetical protein
MYILEYPNVPRTYKHRHQAVDTLDGRLEVADVARSKNNVSARLSLLADLMMEARAVSLSALFSEVPGLVIWVLK